MMSVMRSASTTVAVALCVLGCTQPRQLESRLTPRPRALAQEGRTPLSAPSPAPAAGAGVSWPRLHLSQQGILLNGVRLDEKTQAASLPGGDMDAFVASLQEHLDRARQDAGSSDAALTAAHYALTVEPDVPFRRVKRILRACGGAGYSVVHLSSGEAAFEFLVDGRLGPDADPLVELHELGIHIDENGVLASVFRAAPSSINRGMFKRTLLFERSLPRTTSYIALSEFALAVSDLDPPVCKDSGEPCFDRLSIKADDTLPFGEIASILAGLDSGLRPTLALPWTTGASVRFEPFRVGTFYPGGYLPAEKVYPVVRQYSERFGDCYADARRRNPKLTGVLWVRFEIDLEGKVIKVSQAPQPSPDTSAEPPTKSPLPDLNDPKMVACVLSEFAKIQFARPERTGVIGTYGFSFVP